MSFLRFACLVPAALVLTACGFSSSSGIQPTSTVGQTIKDLDAQYTNPAALAPHQLSRAALNQGFSSQFNAIARSNRAANLLLEDYTVTTSQANAPIIYSDNVNLRDIGQGTQEFYINEGAKTKIGAKEYYVTRHNKVRMYQQDYSVVAAMRVGDMTVQDTQGAVLYRDKQNELIMGASGIPTKKLPKIEVVYSGKAIAEYAGTPIESDFVYRVDFNKRAGVGLINGENNTTIKLEQANIGRTTNLGSEILGSAIHGIYGDASSDAYGTGKYALGFFGENAEEVAGFAKLTRLDVGFAGKR